MLTMIVYYHCKNGQRNEFMQALKDANISALCKSEKGCAQYDYFLSDKDEDTVLLMEKWDKETDQQEHLKTKNFEVLSKIKNQFIESVEIERFLV